MTTQDPEKRMNRYIELLVDFVNNRREYKRQKRNKNPQQLNLN